MHSPNLMILYVNDPIASCHFYEKILEKAPDAVFPFYASFALDNGLNLGLWSTSAQDFVSGGTGSRSEVAFLVNRAEEVDELFDKCKGLGVEIELEPMDAVFGRTFVALDLDGHRLRICLPND